jgi:hypothetical protein
MPRSTHLPTGGSSPAGRAISGQIQALAVVEACNPAVSAGTRYDLLKIDTGYQSGNEFEVGTL